MRVLPITTLSMLLAAALTAQGTPYADSQHRFTLRVPDGWTTQDQGNQGLIFSGSGLSFRIIPLADSASPQETVAKLVQWVSAGVKLQEFDRREITVLGQRTAWTLFEATDSNGTVGAIRVEGIRGGGVTVGVVISGERATYYAQRGSIEAILGTLRLGTNPPIVLPDSGVVAPAAAPAAAPAVAASRQPGIGLEVREITDDDVQELDLDNDDGVVVDQVRQGGPADQAGVHPGDVILELDRTAVDQPAALARMLSMHQAGDSIELLMLRSGRKHSVNVRLEAAP